MKIYPTQEIKGAVFAWLADALNPEPRPPVPPVQLQDGAFDAFLCHAEWAAPWVVPQTETLSNSVGLDKSTGGRNSMVRPSVGTGLVRLT